MKNMKKILALVVAVLMIASMTSAFAANHTISTDSTTHTYEIYQIFTGEVSGDTLTSLKYGANTTGTGRVADEFVSDADIQTLNAITETTDQADLDAILPFVNIDGEPFAKVGKDNEASASVPEGYYLIKDKNNSLSDPEQYTLYLVKILDDDLPIVPKSSITTSDKDVKDINDSTETAVSDPQKSADYDIGDDVPYVLTANLADNVTTYKKYHITFEDTLEAGKLKNNKDYVVKVNGTPTNAYTVVEDSDGGFKIKLEWGNGTTGSITDTTLNGGTVTVEFSAELLAAANIGAEGNINTSHVKYSNNPNDAQGGEEGTTPDDTVITFTYQLTVNKVNEKQEPLDGATFSLYKKQAVAPTGDELTAHPASTVEGYADYYKVETIEGTSLHTFEFKGIDDGQYLLVEDVAPTNYNPLAPQAFTVTAEHDIEWDGETRTDALTSLTGTPETGMVITFSTADDKSAVSTTVINQSGSTLPSTGGMGTTILYIGGSILVLAAVILLITKRRMGSED